MALSFIGKPISLISHSDVRYRGILAGIDPAASTIQLSNVYSMGTESRRPPAEFIPPVQEPYQYIIFRASEVKDLAVDEPTPRRSVHDDPAVLGASAPAAATGHYPQYGSTASYPSGVPPSQIQTQAVQHPQQPQPQQPQAQPQPAHAPPAQDTHAPAVSNRAMGTAPGRRNNSVHTAAASLETVERALGDLRVSNGTAHKHGHGRRGQGAAEIKAGEIKVPATDFDFQSSNALFNKAELAPRKTKDGDRSEDDATNPSEGEDVAFSGKEKAEREKEKEKDRVAYNPQKSFFDTLSSSTQGPPNRGGGDGGVSGGRGRGGGRRAGPAGRNRREEERERNVATFGEPGGVGLMGPGAYVSGWGGYGRRGARPRRVGVRERV